MDPHQHILLETQELVRNAQSQVYLRATESESALYNDAKRCLCTENLRSTQLKQKYKTSSWIHQDHLMETWLSFVADIA